MSTAVWLLAGELEDHMKACPFCAEDIQEAAIKCKHCGEMLSAPKDAGAKQEPVELMNVRCGGTRLRITSEHVQVEIPGVRRQVISRRSLTSVENKVVIRSLLGLGGACALVFHAQGSEAVTVKPVKPKIAQEVMRLLGY